MEGKKINKYGVTLTIIGAVAMILLLCQPVDGLSDLQFLAILAVTKIGGALMVCLLVKLATRWEHEGKIDLNILRHDSRLV